MKKILSLFLIFTLLFTGCSSGSFTEVEIDEELEAELELISSTIREDTINLDFDYTYEIANEDFKNALTKEDLKSAVENFLQPLGDFVDYDKTVIIKSDDIYIVTEYLIYEKSGVILTLNFTEDKMLVGYNVNYYTVENLVSNMPDGISEVDFTVVTGDYSLPAKLTTNIETENKSVLLLVHGSGPNDMNETVFSTKIFEDIAYSMPSMGADVFRYDKRTYVYSENVSVNGDEYITVDDEVIQDALSAARLLKEEGYENVYLVGHSLGGMLGPRIITEEPDLFKGFISLAGSPRTLSEIQIDQIYDLTPIANEEEQKALDDMVNSEKEKLNNIDNFSEEELITQTIFGFSAYYIKDFNSYNTLELANNLFIPMLFLQGDDDFQVTTENDFSLWQTGLSNKENVEFILYPNLTHLFTQSPENPSYTINDYIPIASIDEKVLEDISIFIKKYEN